MCFLVILGLTLPTNMLKIWNILLWKPCLTENEIFCDENQVLYELGSFQMDTIAINIWKDRKYYLFWVFIKYMSLTLSYIIQLKMLKNIRKF